MHLLFYPQPFGNITQAELSDFFDGRSKLAFNRYSLDYLFTHLPPLRIGLPSAEDASRQFYLVLPPQVRYLCCYFVLRWVSCDHSGECHVITAAGCNVITPKVNVQHYVLVSWCVGELWVDQRRKYADIPQRYVFILTRYIFVIFVVHSQSAKICTCEFSK